MNQPVETPEQKEVQQATQEEKFFGVRTAIGKRKQDAQEDAPKIEVQQESTEPVKPEAGPEKPHEDELADYSEKVQKRINKLTYEREEARRQAETAEKMREEAIRVAQQLNQRNQYYQQVIDTGEGTLLKNIRQRAEMSLNAAKAHYAKAYEEGNTQEILAAQEEMLNAKAEMFQVDQQNNAYQQRLRQQQAALMLAQQNQYAPPPKPKPPQPTSRAIEWAKENSWFNDPEHPDMTALAYGLHDALRKKGVQLDSEEYYNAIDSEMRKRFSDYFNQQSSGRSSSGSPSQVVASAERNNGANSRKVKLTSTQIALAKRLGITPEQYAKELIKGA